MRPWNKGLKLGKQSLELIEKRVKARMGYRHSEETKKKIGIAHKGKKVSKETRIKLSLSHNGQRAWNKGLKTGPPKSAFRDRDERITGKNHHLWKNGVSKINKSEREIAWYSGKYRRWRRAVFERDNYTCKACGIRGGYLQADHIKRWVDYPKLRYNLSNGQTLCYSCHLFKTYNADIFVAKRR